MTNNKKGGFTLIEMLVVVAIIGLLSSVVVVGVGGAREKARDTKRIADLRSIQTYLETAYTTEYPDITGTNYPSSLPRDPSRKTGGVADPYSYCRPTDNKQKYILGGTLENVDNRPAGGVAIPYAGCTALVPSILCAATGAVYCVTD